MTGTGLGSDKDGSRVGILDGDRLDPSARVFLIPAHAAPRCVVIRRKPSKVWHIMLWHTDTDEIEHGSWFRGTLYPYRSDLSWDGQYMVYLAAGAGAGAWKAWSGVCRPPWLKTVVDWENTAVYGGGGYFDGARHLSIADYDGTPASTFENLPFKTSRYRPDDSSGEYGVLSGRLARDGWTDLSFRESNFEAVDFWAWKFAPTESHPILRGWDMGSGKSGRHENLRYRFELDGLPDLLTGASWATWDCLGQLLVARGGWIERYTLEDLKRTRPSPSFQFDLDPLTQPPRRSPYGGDTTNE